MSARLPDDGQETVEPSTPRSLDTSTQDDAEWLTTRERGTLLGIRFFIFMATVMGRWPARMFLRVVILYYALFARRARAHSRRYLQRVSPLLDAAGRERLGTRNGVGFWSVYRHLLRFGEVTLDRIFLLKGKTRYFDVTRHGHEHFYAMQERERGSLLLGAHLGSFDAMRLVGRNENVAINVLAYFDNARMLNALLKKLNPQVNTEILSIQRGNASTVLEASEKLDAGELVALLADRVGINDKQVTVRFLGEDAAFPTGPFLLASILRVPVYLTFGLYHAPNRYAIYCEPFAEDLRLPRGSRRDDAIQEVVQRFAARLEEYVLKAPDNWFNFFGFWE